MDTVIYSLAKSTSSVHFFWKPAGAGYTPDLNQAGRFTLDEAKRLCGSGPNRTSVPMLVGEIEKRIQFIRRVDTEWVENGDAFAALVAKGKSLLPSGPVPAAGALDLKASTAKAG